MRRFLFGICGDASPAERWHPIVPDPQVSARTGVINHAPTGNPMTLPSWLTEADLDVYTSEFERTGFRGGLNWYRNFDRNWELLAACRTPIYRGLACISQPTLFLWGDKDPILEIAGVSKSIERMQQYVPNLRKTVFPDSGHWIQHERARREAIAANCLGDS